MTVTRRQFTLRALTALGLALLPGTACQTTPQIDTDAEPGGTLLFVNESLEIAEVFAVARAVSQVRLGVVMQGERQTFEIPARLMRQGSNLNIVARSPGRARSISSGPINATAGRVIEVTLPLAGTHLIIETGRR